MQSVINSQNTPENDISHMSVGNDRDGHYSDTEYDLGTRDIAASFASLSDELKIVNQHYQLNRKTCDSWKLNLIKEKTNSIKRNEA